MGFLDKLKEGADQARDLAGQAVDRAKDEAKELNLKRQIAAAEGDLGRATFELVEQGAIAHASLAGPADRVRSLRADLAALQEAQGADGGEGAGGESAADGSPGPDEPAEPATTASAGGAPEPAGDAAPPSGGTPS